ncbi:MAG: SigE family RNA polymerase sigma factor [Nakamurella sp.]
MAVADTGWNFDPAGDVPLSFTAFDRAARPGLVRYAALLCGSPSTADDLVQDVLVRVHRRWSLITGDPTSYARVAVTREFLSWRRQRWRTVVPWGDALPEVPVFDVTDDGPDPVLWAAVQQLPRQQRAALVLRYYLERSDDETAETLGCRPGTVRTHLSRALGTLRHQLGALTTDTPTDPFPETENPR